MSLHEWNTVTSFSKEFDLVVIYFLGELQITSKTINKLFVSKKLRTKP